MGYGWDLFKSGRKTRLVKDGGIDGIIDEDRLGLEQIYIQEKHYNDSSVQSLDVDKFVGAIVKHKASKGVLLTTSRLTDSAIEAAKKSSGTVKIILIDGERLTQLMIEHNVGVSVIETLELKEIDSDFFEQGD